MITKFDLKYVFKRVIIAIIISLILSFLGVINCKAITTNVTDDIDNIKINNSYLKTNNKVYNAGNANTTIELLTQGESYSQQWKYVYVAYCSAFGNMPDRYVNSYIINTTTYISDITIYNTSQTCTIYGTNAYNATGRAVYYVLNLRDAWWNYENGLGNGNLKFTIYQNGSTEYTLISYGFNKEGFDFSNLNNNAVSVEINNQTTAINNQTTEIQNVNDSLNDTTPVAQNEISGNTSDWNSKNISNGTITQLLTMPITLINAYINGMSGTCSGFSLGSLYGEELILPCINVSDYLGSALWSVIDVLFSGFMIFAIGKKLIKIFNDFTNIKTNQVDELYGGGA